MAAATIVGNTPSRTIARTTSCVASVRQPSAAPPPQQPAPPSAPTRQRDSSELSTALASSASTQSRVNTGAHGVRGAAAACAHCLSDPELAGPSASADLGRDACAGERSQRAGGQPHRTTVYLGVSRGAVARLCTHKNTHNRSAHTCAKRSLARKSVAHIVGPVEIMNTLRAPPDRRVSDFIGRARGWRLQRLAARLAALTTCCRTW